MRNHWFGQIRCLLCQKSTDLSEKVAGIWKKLPLESGKVVGTGKKLSESGKGSRNLGKVVGIWEKLVEIWKKLVRIWKKWPDFNGRWAGRVSRVLEEEVRHPTRRRRVFEVGTRVRPLELSDRMIPGRVRSGGAGWAGGRFIWTALAKR